MVIRAFYSGPPRDVPPNKLRKDEVVRDKSPSIPPVLAEEAVQDVQTAGNGDNKAKKELAATADVAKAQDIKEDLEKRM